MPAETPKAFISYSWDDEDHQTWVRELAERLVLNGVEVKLDQWDVQPGRSLTQFMEEQIPACDFVIVVCTPNYASRSQQRTGGVGYEQQIISGRIAAGMAREKFLPVIRRGSLALGDDCALPAHFAGILAIDARTAEDQDAAMEQLLRAIYGKPKHVPPPLGPPPSFEYLAFKEVEDDFGTLRLPSLELDGWSLDSGVVRNEHSPNTFHIPDEAQRNSVVPGCFVKLAFELLDPDEEASGPSVERMWVKVSGRKGPYYIGTLANNPATWSYISEEDEEKYIVDENSPIKFGSRVVFLPEHVIDIVEGD